METNTDPDGPLHADRAAPSPDVGSIQEDDPGGEAEGAGAPVESLFAAQREQIEGELEHADGYDRDDLLAIYGRSAAATGRFDMSAAAYTMFLEEFGHNHPYSERIAMRLADALAPLRLDDIQVTHAPDGPVFRPRWRMGYEPTLEQLERALGAYELAASLASEDRLAGQALLKLGWVYRALGDWQSSTAAWDRCAAECPGTRTSEKAILLAAENLEWTGQAKEAAERLRVLARDAAEMRAEDLEAQADRTGDWFSDPVAALRNEISVRASQRPAYEVYASAARWLDRRGERNALIDISRWAGDQDAWPVEAQIACRIRLVDALLNGPEISDDDRLEAANALGEIASLAPDDGGAIPSMRRQSQLLIEAGRFDEAEQVLTRAEDRSAGSHMWEPVILGDWIKLLLNEGDHEAARRVFETLSDLYPESSVTEQYRTVLANTAKERTK